MHTTVEAPSEKQAVPIADLNVDQLSYFQRQLNQEIVFLSESLKVYRISSFWIDKF